MSMKDEKVVSLKQWQEHKMQEQITVPCETKAKDEGLWDEVMLANKLKKERLKEMRRKNNEKAKRDYGLDRRNK